jgi:hypothetical protein
MSATYFVRTAEARLPHSLIRDNGPRILLAWRASEARVISQREGSAPSGDRDGAVENRQRAETPISALAHRERPDRSRGVPCVGSIPDLFR